MIFIVQDEDDGDYDEGEEDVEEDDIEEEEEEDEGKSLGQVKRTCSSFLQVD